MTHGAKNGGSFSEIMGPSISNLTTVDIWVVYFTYTLTQTLVHLFVCLFVCFVALRPKSTAMVIAGRPVHLTTLFPGQA